MSGVSDSAPVGATFENVDDSARPEHFQNYLSDFAALAEVQRYKQVALALCGLEAGQHVLDVGCGVGDDVRRIASRVAPGGSATGIDRSAAMIDACRGRESDGVPGRFGVAEGTSLPFDDGRFDVVRADRVLVHVADPVPVVREMVRVLKPGGRIVLTEGDFDTLVIDSEDLGFARRVADLRCAEFRNGRIGRRLAGLLRESEIDEISSSAASIIFRERASAERFWGLTDLVLKATARGELPPGPAERWLIDQRRRDENGRFFCSLTGFAAVGRRED